MSVMKAVSFVPEMLLDAPREIRSADAARKIRECKGVAFLKMYRGGCILTVRGGSGVVIKRNEDGSWGAPCGVTMMGPAIGASIGVQVSDYILFFNSETALNGFVSNVGTVGVSGTLAAGSVGRDSEALITTASREGITAFCSARGLYGGVSLEFSGVAEDKTANRVQYGRPLLATEILNSEPKPKGEVFDKMYAALDDMMKIPLDEPAPAESSQPEAVASQ